MTETFIITGTDGKKEEVKGLRALTARLKAGQVVNVRPKTDFKNVRIVCSLSERKAFDKAAKNYPSKTALFSDMVERALRLKPTKLTNKSSVIQGLLTQDRHKLLMSKSKQLGVPASELVRQALGEIINGSK